MLRLRDGDVMDLLGDAGSRPARRELDPGIVDEAAAGVDLLPGPGELQPRCSCPDWADPCKHSAAVCSLAARRSITIRSVCSSCAVSIAAPCSPVCGAGGLAAPRPATTRPSAPNGPPRASRPRRRGGRYRDHARCGPGPSSAPASWRPCRRCPPRPVLARTRRRSTRSPVTPSNGHGERASTGRPPGSTSPRRRGLSARQSLRLGRVRG